MPLPIKLSASARADLLEAWSYIAEDDMRAADAVLDRVLDVAHKLADWPEMGRERPELMEHLRSFPVGVHVIFYRVHRGSLEIVRVLHGRQDINSAF